MTPEALKIAERPDPAPGAGQVTIRVRAAGVNRPDLLQRTGGYPPPPGASDVMGLEVAGEIAAVGANVTRWRVGDRVCALLGGGGYAETALVDARHVLPIPDGLDYVQAAALPETVFTVFANVFEAGGLKAGQTLLIHGATSGIGVTAIQMAKAAGATVIVTAGSDEKCTAALELGADHAINYKATDFAEEARRLTGGQGVDVILDMVAGDYVKREVDCLAEDGRLVIIAVQGGTKADFNAGLVLRRRLTITGSTLRPRPVAFKAAIAQALKARVWPWLADGTIKPVIHSVFPATEAGDGLPSGAARAHALMQSNQHIGKIVLTWN